MGAWAEKGFDNDSACDWMDGVTEIVRFTLLHAFWSRWQEEGVAAAQFLSELPTTFQERLGVHIFTEALEVVDEELKPAAITPWKHPAKRKRYLTTLRKKLAQRHSLFPKPRRKRRTIVHAQ